jgi:hypothetical protein
MASIKQIARSVLVMGLIVSLFSESLWHASPPLSLATSLSVVGTLMVDFDVYLD